MAAWYDKAVEAEKAGTLRPEVKTLLDEARARGLVPAPETSWGDVAKGAYNNFGSSAKGVVSSLVQPFVDPKGTALGLANLAAGVGSKIVGVADSASEAIGGPDLQTPEDAAASEAPLNAVVDFYKQRYGSLEGFKQAFAKDPVGVAADLSAGVMGAGGVVRGVGTAAAQAPGVVGRAGPAVNAAGRAIQTVGSYLDPVADAGRVAGNIGRGAGRVLDLSTGLGNNTVNNAVADARAGGIRGQRLVDNMRDNVPINNVVDEARGAVGDLSRERSQAYDAGMAATRADQTPLDVDALLAEIQNQRNTVNFRGVAGTGDPRALNALDDIEQMIQQFDTRTAGTGRVAEGFDHIKKRIGDMRDYNRTNDPDQRVIGNMYHATRDQITNQVPDYARSMQNFEAASDAIDDATRTFSLGRNASDDTALRKLQSITRNNVSTNYGARELTMADLEQARPGLSAAIRGQAFNSWLPRGLARPVAGVGAAGAAYSGGLPALLEPNTLMLAAASSPRIVGEGANLVGRTLGGVDALLDRAGVGGLNAADMAPVTSSAVQAGRSAEQAAPAAQTDAALTRFRDALTKTSAGQMPPDEFARTLNITAQILAKQTGMDRATIEERLRAVAEGQR
ncbi:hypothetical protein [Sphingorhabdus sp.]|uniref:hypothetical protein n=1 Tax=Sphingorhabdus sp. TaxID=1902408 RepID=UPI002FDE3E09